MRHCAEYYAERAFSAEYLRPAPHSCALSFSIHSSLRDAKDAGWMAFNAELI
jgi:hypothetical protein